jgi:energy-coupling factor transport system permease protein
VSEFEFLRNVTIGQYLEGDSVVHHLDPRAKLIALTALLTGVVTTPSLAALSVTLGLVCAMVWCARIPFRYALRGVRAAAPFLLFVAVVQMLTVPQHDVGSVLWRWWRVTIALGDLRMAVVTIARFFVLILGLSLFSFTTSTTQVTHGIEHLFRPLQRIGFPAHELSLVAVIALRFVPLLALEAERLAKAQASRGADFGRGSGNPFTRARRMLPLLVPLFVTALRRAETLAMAMEARCYTGGQGRTHLIQLRARSRDAAAALLCLAWAGLLIATAWLNPDAYLASLL